MSLFWFVVVPSLLLSTGVFIFWLLRRWHFFSNRARDLREVHLEFQELRIEEFEKLVCAEADEYINREWRLSRRLRRQASINRIKIVRGWLHRIALNGALCMEVARFNIAKIEQDANLPAGDREQLTHRIFDRGAMCQLMAAVCLARLYGMEFRMVAWPFYLPRLAGSFELRGHDLAAWYGHLVDDVLDLACEDQRHWLYENVLFTLTGLVELPDSGQA